MTAEETISLQALYDELKPRAVVDYIEFFLARCPAAMQQDMKDLVAADLAIPPEAPAVLALAKPEKRTYPAYPGSQNPHDYTARCC